MRIPSDYISEIKRILDSISSSLPGYKTRLSQKRMIAAIAEVLSRAPAIPASVDGAEPQPAPENSGHSILCVQGPTGVGKSLAYLIGATVAARAQQRKLVVASATVALQEQLINRDIPFFLQNSGLNLTCAIAKGRGRYVCHAKLRRAAGEHMQDELFTDDESTDQFNAAEMKIFAGLLADYEANRWSGDRDELPGNMNDQTWAQATIDRHSCLNSKCPQFRSCAQMAARDRIKAADIIVANHDLLLADLALGGGVILPDPANTFYVLDEGHHIAQKAVDTFSCQHQINAGHQMMVKLGSSANRFGQIFPEHSPLAVNINESADFLSEALADAYTMFHSIEKIFFSYNIWRFPNNRLPEDSETLASNILVLSGALLKDIASALDELRSKEAVNTQKLLSDFGFFKGRVQAIHDTWRLLNEVPPAGGVPIAKWVSLEEKGGKVDFVVNACPVVAARMLADSFFKKAAGVVVTSATLMTLGNFDQLLRETGLELLPDTSLLELPSPFNHALQGVLRIPDIKASAKHAEPHTAAIVVHLPALIAETGNRGTLVLFASRKQMNDVSNALPPEVRRLLLIQGERSKDVLLEEHLCRIKAGEPSVLFGLQSFSEGLDLPGDACGHVIIAKIPFAVPNNPVQETLSLWLESQNKSYFNEIAVPQACVKLIQSAGRLIRTETDTGILTILDERMVKTNYGRKMSASLPPFRRVA